MPQSRMYYYSRLLTCPTYLGTYFRSKYFIEVTLLGNVADPRK